MSFLRDPSVEMVNVRRVVISLVTAVLLLTGAALQAGAQVVDAAHLATARHGLALGLQAADEVVADVATGRPGPSVEQAMRVLSILEANLAKDRGNGRGPVRAIEVHQALLEGDLPSSVDGGRDGVPGLAKAYGLLRAQLRGDGRSNRGGPATTP